MLSAEFCFALATVFVKYITNGSDIPPIEISFFRVSIGAAVTFLFMKREKLSFRPKMPSLVIWRAILGCSALIAFFYSVQLTSVTKANMLNMTYPVFIFIVAPLFSIQKIHQSSIIFLLVAMAGIYLVILPDFSKVNMGDVLGLVSGVIAAFAIIILSKARQYDSTILIVFYLMAIGTLCNGLLMIPFFVLPNRYEILLLCASGVTGVTGQIFLTKGYKHVNPKTGSMISSSRILFATLMGVIFFSEILKLNIVTGGIMIVISIIGISALQRINKTNMG